jgi:hypothetical protein
MMAWILVSLLAGWVVDAAVTLSPESNAAPTQAADGAGLPPKP